MKLLVTSLALLCLVAGCGAHVTRSVSSAPSSTTVSTIATTTMSTILTLANQEKNNVAEENLRNAYLKAKAEFTASKDYTQSTTDKLHGAMRIVQFVGPTDVSTGPAVISVSTPDANNLILAGKSDAGTCFFVRDIEGDGAGTTYASSQGTCSAALTSGLQWAPSWE